MGVQRGPDAKPHIKWNHVDGPLLICADGTPHFLTMQERLWLRFGFTSIEALDKNHNRQPCRG